jgi:esterase
MNGYIQVGHGLQKVLVLGGWLGEAADWIGVVGALDPNAFTFVLFDYRGYGRSKHLFGTYTFAESADDALRLADHLGWRRFSMIGHSMGGVAIQRILLAAPERIEMMVAVNAVPACSARMDLQRLALFESAVGDVTKREIIIDTSTGHRLPRTWLSHRATHSMDVTTPAAFYGYLKEWATVDFSRLVQGNQTLVQVITAEFDPTLTYELMERTWLTWYPNSSAITLANSGHYPMFEVPLALAASLQSFFHRESLRGTLKCCEYSRLID